MENYEFFVFMNNQNACCNILFVISIFDDYKFSKKNKINVNVIVVGIHLYQIYAERKVSVYLQTSNHIHLPKQFE